MTGAYLYSGKCVRVIKSRVWKDGLVSRVLVVQAEDLSTEPQNPIEEARYDPALLTGEGWR